MRAPAIYLFLGALWTLTLPTCRGQHDPVVKVNEGYLRGMLEPGASGTAPYYAFRGIPFAEPPVGNLRFKAPRPPTAWDGIRDATKEGNMCSQYTLEGTSEGSEDCLFLNVYTPKLVCESALLPVIVYIYGSGFYSGDAGSKWYGPDFINYKDVILVMANHRLGPLGFLNLKTPVAPGNAALKDTLAVLRWVNGNIEAFCGDPSRVTIGGLSSGAMIAQVHVYIPKSQGLFQRALLMSGNALASGCHSDTPLDAAKELGELMGVQVDSVASLEAALMAATPEEINKAYFTMLMTEPHPTNMLKFVLSSEEVAASEGDLEGSTLLVTDPETLIRNSQVRNPVPILTGTTAEEMVSPYAIGLLTVDGNEAKFLERLNSRFVEILQRETLKVPVGVGKMLNVPSGVGEPEQQQKVLQLVRNKYFNGSPIFDRTQYISVMNDIIFVGPLLNFLKLCSGEVVLYRTDVETSYNFVTRGLLKVDYAKSTAHGDDVGYIFRPYSVDLGQDYGGTGLAPEVLRYVTTLFTDFAKGKTVGARVHCGAASHPFININSKQPTISDGYGSEAVLWQRVFNMRRGEELGQD